MIDLPKEYEERMLSLLGKDFEAYKSELQKDSVKGFRINTEKISAEDFEKINIFGNEKIPYVHNGYYLDYEKVGNHPFHHAGMIYVQEPAAMAPAECVEINEDWKILDMCAAPGGKSTQLRNKLGKNGVLVSNEIIPSRCKILTGNIERLGLTNVVTTCMDTEKLSKTFPKTFDLIMVDAPCSGEGMFRKEAVAVSEWSKENVLMCAERQEKILENAVKCLKDGGFIIYSTCTFSLEENEMVVDAFLQKHPEFKIMKTTEEVERATESGIIFDGCQTNDIHFARRFYPHKSKGEGQFMAVLKNTNEPLPQYSSCQKPKTPDKTVTEFLNDTLTEYDIENVRMYNNNPVYFTPDFQVKDGVAFCCGITIGEIKKNYILPHHQFFMGMGKYFKRKIELSSDSEEIMRYLHGEEIKTNISNGWAVVTVNGCAIGGAKVVSGIAKNHYPKGLRIKNI
ncbi:MAG: NOL1/NOP2/sun family putative RNA methylase [Clostridia bacterium]|nr:NOL1/NOP2/sun family putative RNA methylase [Clostridia bacterium]